MLKKILNIVSYAALLLLLMPPRDIGIIMIAILFIIGTCVIVNNKNHMRTIAKSKKYIMIVISISIVVVLGSAFYNRWLPSSKINSIASGLQISNKALLIIGTIVLVILSIKLSLVCIQKFYEIYSQSGFVRSIVACLIAAFTTVILAQIMINTEALTMGYLNFMYGVLIVALPILLLYGLSSKVVPSIIIGSGIFMILSTINTYVYIFRGRLFEPVDIFALGTAKNVAESYSLVPVPTKIVSCWIVFVCIILLLNYLQHKKKLKIGLERRLALLVICAVGGVVVSIYSLNLKTYHWENEGAKYNGYILDFVAKVKEISVP